MVKLVTIFMLIALYFFNCNIVSDHWGRVEGRGLGAFAQKILSNTGSFSLKNTTFDTKNCHRGRGKLSRVKSKE